MGIEPTSEAWEAKAYLTKTLERRHFSSFGQCLKRKITENGVKGRREAPHVSTRPVYLSYGSGLYSPDGITTSNR